MLVIDVDDNSSDNADVLSALRTLDLNLLVVFDALMQERNVTRAGERLGLSQSATSGALARLRALFDDPLFQRTNTGIEPTPRAMQAVLPIRSALSKLKLTLDQPTFHAEDSTRTFRVAMSDHVSISLLAQWLAELKTIAPRTTLNVVSTSRHNAAEVLSGDVELAIGLFRNAPPSIEQKHLWATGFGYLVRNEHPMAAKRMTVDRYTKLNHLLVSPGGRRIGAVDKMLSSVGRTRSVDIVVPDWTVAGTIVTQTDYVLSGPDLVIDTLASIFNLKARPLPKSIQPRHEIDAIWHRSLDRDPGHIFLRDSLWKTAAQVRKKRRPAGEPTKRRG